MPEASAAKNQETAQDRAQDILNHVAGYWREVAVVAFLLVGGAGVFAYLHHAQQAAEQAAWKAIFMAEYESDRRQDGRLAARLEEACKSHPGAQATICGRFRRLAALAEQDDHAGTQDAARDFLQAAPAHFLAPQARLIRARSLMAAGKYDLARSELDQIREPGHLEPLVRLARAQCLEREAENQRQDDPESYARLLENVREAYLKADALGEKGWPPQVSFSARFALHLVQDRLAGPGPAVAAPGQAAPDEGADPGAADQDNPGEPGEAAPAAEPPAAGKGDAPAPEGSKPAAPPPDDDGEPDDGAE